MHTHIGRGECRGAHLGGCANAWDECWVPSDHLVHRWPHPLPLAASKGQWGRKGWWHLPCWRPRPLLLLPEELLAGAERASGAGARPHPVTRSRTKQPQTAACSRGKQPHQHGHPGCVLCAPGDRCPQLPCTEPSTLCACSHTQCTPTCTLTQPLACSAHTHVVCVLSLCTLTPRHVLLVQTATLCMLTAPIHAFPLQTQPLHACSCICYTLVLCTHAPCAHSSIIFTHSHTLYAHSPFAHTFCAHSNIPCKLSLCTHTHLLCMLRHPLCTASVHTFFAHTPPLCMLIHFPTHSHPGACSHTTYTHCPRCTLTPKHT